jgi:hypothetical protein
MTRKIFANCGTGYESSDKMKNKKNKIKLHTVGTIPK